MDWLFPGGRHRRYEAAPTAPPFARRSKPQTTRMYEPETDFPDQPLCMAGNGWIPSRIGCVPLPRWM
ncbi:hypothetical protein FHS34_003048 [Streptomyces echinatus]|uniref:Uncharacterized protein n=1 Tax=Streptomyces echinatus TaxID=67293 RepID=A0A7W9PTL0_9ACTN|nr:hypothetical protein [Streptomyces echinatus]